MRELERRDWRASDLIRQLAANGATVKPRTVYDALTLKPSPLNAVALGEIFDALELVVVPLNASIQAKPTPAAVVYVPPPNPFLPPNRQKLLAKRKNAPE